MFLNQLYLCYQGGSNSGVAMGWLLGCDHAFLLLLQGTPGKIETETGNKYQDGRGIERSRGGRVKEREIETLKAEIKGARLRRKRNKCGNHEVRVA